MESKGFEDLTPLKRWRDLQLAQTHGYSILLVAILAVATSASVRRCSRGLVYCWCTSAPTRRTGILRKSAKLFRDSSSIHWEFIGVCSAGRRSQERMRTSQPVVLQHSARRKERQGGYGEGKLADTSKDTTRRRKPLLLVKIKLWNPRMGS